MGIIRRWKNSIISLRLRFLEIPHKENWVSWGVHFKGLGVQKGTQTPCWLRPWMELYWNKSEIWNEILKSLPFKIFSFNNQIKLDMNEGLAEHCVVCLFVAGPYWVEKPESINVGEQETGTFTCVATGYPQPTIEWFINGVALSSKYRI